jgi:hypothetical protein
MAAGGACGIDVVEIRRVGTNQLHFKADQTALAMCLFKLRPKLPKYTIFGYERLHRVQRRYCHCAPVHKIANSLPLVFRLGTAAPSPGFDKGRSSLRPWRASVQETFCKAANVVVVIVERRLHYSSAADIFIQLCTFPFGSQQQL